MAGFRGRDVISEAIVLRSRTIRDHDILVDLLTPVEGRFWGVARYGRKSQKRFGPVLETLNRLKIRYRDRDQGMMMLEEATLQAPIIHTRLGLEALLSAFYLVDLVREFIPEKNQDPRLYPLLSESLTRLHTHKPSQVCQEFESRFLKLSGYGLSLESCQSCQKPWEKSQSFFFVFLQGGVFCADCLPPTSDHLSYTPDSLKKILPLFLEYQLGKSLRSRKVLTQTLV